MSKKQPRNTKGKIISAAWKLFYEQGYDDTTIDEIIAESATSKGSFYHYFEGKDALLGSLSFLFDEKYMELEAQLSGFATRYEQLIYLNQELFSMIENSISLDLLARLLSTQLITKGEKHLLDRNRYYYKLLRRIIREGQDGGEFRPAQDCSGTLAFPARVLSFLNLGYGMEQILHGSVCLRMQASVGTNHMPESTVLFTILF